MTSISGESALRIENSGVLDLKGLNVDVKRSNGLKSFKMKITLGMLRIDERLVNIQSTTKLWG